MATTTPSAALVAAAPVFTGRERVALAGFLAGYSGLTRHAYELDLRQYASWCRLTAGQAGADIHGADEALGEATSAGPPPQPGAGERGRGRSGFLKCVFHRAFAPGGPAPCLGLLEWRVADLGAQRGQDQIVVRDG
jgi:hypothetical protein